MLEANPLKLRQGSPGQQKGDNYDGLRLLKGRSKLALNYRLLFLFSEIDASAGHFYLLGTLKVLDQ